jgi:hypothetical protein
MGMGGAGNGAAGGMGGAGGSNMVDAGMVDLSNTMRGSIASSAAGITTIAQNSGTAALVQQGVNVQANLNLGH